MRNLMEKSRPPVSKPTGGMRMSLTSELMIPPKAAPIITPTARSTAFPLIANSLNSFHIAVHRTNRRRYLQAFWGLQSRCPLSYQQFAPEFSGSTTQRFSSLHPLQQAASSFDRAPLRLFEAQVLLRIRQGTTVLLEAAPATVKVTRLE